MQIFKALWFCVERVDFRFDTNDVRFCAIDEFSRNTG